MSGWLIRSNTVKNLSLLFSAANREKREEGRKRGEIESKPNFNKDKKIKAKKKFQKQVLKSLKYNLFKDLHCFLED